MARDSSLRASDADRDAVAERLRVAAVEGRLEPDELEQRVGAALRARTYGELDRLLADLPGRRIARVASPRPVLPIAARVAAVLVVLALVPVVLAAGAAWLLIWAVIWLTLRAGKGSCAARHRRHSDWHHAPRAWRV